MSKTILASALACLFMSFGTLSIADEQGIKGCLKNENDGKTWAKSGSVTGPRGNVTSEGDATINWQEFFCRRPWRASSLIGYHMADMMFNE